MLIVGLGNPGKEYAKTHHNVGFMFVDEVAKSYNVTFKLEKKFQCYIGEFIQNGKKHYLMKPTTYMNLSGHAVRLFSDYYHIERNDIFVIYDDMDLPIGARRIRKSGSAGGHNGMKSMIKEVGTSDIARLRLGIGRSKEDSQEKVIDFVLSNFSKVEMNILNETLNISANIINDLLNNGIDYIMNNYNK